MVGCPNHGQWDLFIQGTWSMSLKLLFASFQDLFGCVLELLGKTVHHSASQLSSEANADDHDVLANAAGVWGQGEPALWDGRAGGWS